MPSMPLSVTSFRKMKYRPPKPGGGLPTMKVLSSLIFMISPLVFPAEDGMRRGKSETDRCVRPLLHQSAATGRPAKRCLPDQWDHPIGHGLLIGGVTGQIPDQEFLLLE